MSQEEIDDVVSKITYHLRNSDQSDSGYFEHIDNINLARGLKLSNSDKDKALEEIAKYPEIYDINIDSGLIKLKIKGKNTLNYFGGFKNYKTNKKKQEDETKKENGLIIPDTTSTPELDDKTKIELLRIMANQYIKDSLSATPQESLETISPKPAVVAKAPSSSIKKKKQIQPKKRGLGTEKSAPAKSKGHKHLLLIGINEYEYWRKLKTPIKDIDDLKAVLLERYDFDKNYITILKNEQATRTNITNTLHKFTKPSEIGADDSLLIYYAGHGHLDHNEEGYWAPVDSKPDDISSFIPNTVVHSNIRQMKCRHVLLISDSCFSGTLLTDDRDTRTFERVVGYLQSKESRWVITSGGHDQVVEDGLINSPFAEAIVSELRHNQDKNLLADTLAQRVRGVTWANALQVSQYGRIYRAGDKGGLFVFTLFDHEDASWRLATRENTISGYVAFLEKFSESKHLKEAYQMIGRIAVQEHKKFNIQENRIEILKELIEEHERRNARLRSQLSSQKLLSKILFWGNVLTGLLVVASFIIRYFTLFK